jgi:hypothetical protein
MSFMLELYWHCCVQARGYIFIMSNTHSIFNYFIIIGYYIFKLQNDHLLWINHRAIILNMENISLY